LDGKNEIGMDESTTGSEDENEENERGIYPKLGKNIEEEDEQAMPNIRIDRTKPTGKGRAEGEGGN
jgi:hypothetical protein